MFLFCGRPERERKGEAERGRQKATVPYVIFSGACNPFVLPSFPFPQPRSQGYITARAQYGNGNKRSDVCQWEIGGTRGAPRPPPRHRGPYSVVYRHRDVCTKLRAEGDNTCGRRWERDCHAHTGKNESEFKTQLLMATELERRLAHLRIPQEKTPMLSIELC